MSAPDIDDDLLSSFSALTDGAHHLTILLGAGASAPSGLPAWDEFAKRVALLSGLVSSERAATVLLQKQDQTIVLEAARAHSGEVWADHLHSALYGGLEGPPSPSPLHLAVAGHYLASRESTTLGTLNFDILLEQAIADSGEPLVLVGLDGRQESEAPTVHHLHGAIFDESAYEPVVGFRDYAELVAKENAWQREFLSSALQRGPLLLAGTSYRDPDIRHWLHLILRDERPDHPALVTIAREGLGLDRETFDEVYEALASEWGAIGLRALHLQDLTDVALMIRELRYLGGDSYRSPNERSRRVWEEHTKRFPELQDLYGVQLLSDSKKVARATGAKVHRGTLWLANGRSELARWASDDARYQTSRSLKYVPTGHDSPWIAGEALAAEEVKLKNVTRDRGISPRWRSVLAIPIFVEDGHSPSFASAVVTFGLDRTAETLMARQQNWVRTINEISENWDNCISTVSFPEYSD